jgi:hypothetical protein
MRTIITSIVATLIVAGLALAAGLPHTPGNTIIQNLTGLSDTNTRSDDTTGTKGVFKSYSAAGYTGINATVVDTTGAGVNVKWREDGNLVWVGPTFSATNNGGAAFSTLSYEPYSSTSRKLKAVVRRQ